MKVIQVLDNPRAGVKLLMLSVLMIAGSAFAQDEMQMDGMGNLLHDDAKDASPAAALYEARCAHCHDQPTGRIPPRATLRYRPPEGIYGALIGNGVMSPMYYEFNMNVWILNIFHQLENIPNFLV